MNSRKLQVKDYLKNIEMENKENFEKINEELEYFQNKLKETMGKGLPKKYLETTELGDVDKELEHRFKLKQLQQCFIFVVMCS